MTPLSRSQLELLAIAERQGWLRPTTANDRRTAAALIRRDLLEVHPAYDGTVLRACGAAL